MNKYIFNIYVTFILFASALISCNTSEVKFEPEDTSNTEEIKIDFDTSKILPISSLIDTVQQIKLETNENNIIGEISKICSTKQKLLYILDRITNIISAFDYNGHLVLKINKNGMGVGEYKTITDFQIDKNASTIGIVDVMKRKFIKLDLAGNLIKEYPVNNMIGITKFSFLDNGDIAFSRGIPPEIDARKFSLIVTDKDLKLKESLLRYRNSSSATISAYNPFQRFESETYYLPVYSNKIYSVDSNGVKPKYKLSFGNKWIPDDYAFSPAHTNGYRWIFNELPKSNFVYFVNFTVTEKNVLIYFDYKGESYLTIYDKETKKQLSTKLDNDYKIMGFNGLNTNTFANIYYVGYISNLQQIKNIKDHRFNDLLKNYDNITSRENPIILLTTFKKIL